jgi:hypothetical protein
MSKEEQDGRLSGSEVLSKAETILHTVTSCREPLYRTRWLMAHNRLHAIVHESFSSELMDSWNEYLKELENAEAIAKKPA